MDLYCTRPGCPRPINICPDLDDTTTVKTVQQKYCVTCGMPLILVGRYLPLRLLGQGGFGAAFLARDRYTPGMRHCVVKQFQPSGNLSPSQLQLAQQLFEREAEVLEQLGNAHPQIPDLLAFFELADPNQQPGRQTQFFYLVQEFIDGKTMEEELAKKGPLPETQVREVLEEILKVLQFVHDNGSIHRDIKPSNIMRHRNGRLYLLDFGAVKRATKGGGRQGSTGIYSLGFAPPEQMAGGEVFPSTDLYALAVTCLMLLTGKAPNELFDAYRNAWNWRSYARVSDRLATVLDRMLLPTPGDRFQSVSETLAALAQPISPPAVATPPPRPLPVPPPPTTAPPTRSHPVPAPVPRTISPAPSPAAPGTHIRQRSTVAPVSTLELLGFGAFAGFEAALLAIVLLGLPLPLSVKGGLWLVCVGMIVFAQFRRWIKRGALVAIAGITLALVLFVPGLGRGVMLLGAGDPRLLILVLSGLMALLGVAVTALVRLIYKLIAAFL